MKHASTPSPSTPHTRWFVLAIVALVCTLAYLGLTPFEFTPPNDVRWDARLGLSFDGRGIVVSEDAFVWPAPARSPADRAFTLAMLLESAGPVKDDLGTILSLDDTRGHPLFLIAQWRESLVVRVRAADPSRLRPYWELGVVSALPARQRRLVTLASDPTSGTAIYVDGRLALEDARAILPDPIGDDQRLDAPRPVRLVLGSSVAGRARWRGWIRSLALHGRALDATEVARSAHDPSDPHSTADAEALPDADLLAFFDFGGSRTDRVPNQAESSSIGALSVPDVFTPVRRTVLEYPWRRSFHQTWLQQDAARNLIGFIPLGMLVGLVLIDRFGVHRRWLLVAATILSGAALGLALELIQVFMPARVSSIVDLFLNSLGTAIGSVVALALRSRG